MSWEYQIKPQLPWTLGGESAGVVTKIGKGVTDISPGDRVMMLGGGLIEHVNVRSTGLWRIPDNFPFEKAAAVPVNYGTTWFALHQRGDIQPGETLLVTAAAGGTGSAAIQLGKAAGAVVIAIAGGSEKTKQAKLLGADHVIDHRLNLIGLMRFGKLAMVELTSYTIQSEEILLIRSDDVWPGTDDF